jgi:putative ABC transport system permease protein
MFTNYLKIAWRSLRKQGLYSLINIVGLAAGLACCLLILLYVVDELSYDRYNAKADRTYRLHADIRFGGDELDFAVTPDPLGPTLKKDYPQVEQFVRLHDRGTWAVKRVGTLNTIRERVLFADSTLFDVFTLPLVAGNPKQALTQPKSVVISESAAKRHFGNTNPVGQSMQFDKLTFRVMAVMRDMPANSHFRTDFFLSMRDNPYDWDQWLSQNLHTYVVLKPGSDPADLARHFDAVIDTYAGAQAKAFLGTSMQQLRASGNRFRFWMMPLTDIHLHSKQTFQLAPTSDIGYVYAFSVVALFILVIACINFMNLSTARSAMRAKEVGVRKVMGSGQGQLIRQFMAEAVLTSTLAMALAVGLVALAIPLFNDVANKQLTAEALLSPFWLVVLVALPLVVGLLAGTYPAFFLASYRPIAVLKGAITGPSAGLGRLAFGSTRLRSGLVVFQFMMSVLLIIGTLVVYRQMTYIQTRNLGFNREQVLTVFGADVMGKQAETFRQQVLQLPGVVAGSVSGYLPTPSDRSNTTFFPDGQIDQSKAVTMQSWRVDYDYTTTLGLQMAQGRAFSQAFGADSAGVVLNETAAKLLGGNVIGKRLDMYVDVVKKLTKTYMVVGVVKNFHYESLRQEVGGLALLLNDGPSTAVSFRLAAGGNSGTLVRQIEAKWKAIAPGESFTYGFMDDSFEQMYRTEQRIGTLTLTFAGLAILIACLGLFGLAAFTAQQRTKEIGVRKVLGASVPSLIALLSKDFLKLVLIAILLASPLAGYVMQHWLDGFAYRVELEWWVFALAGTLAVSIALLTVSFQSVKAALMNPVKSLRSE